jgi:hypothetical protein
MSEIVAVPLISMTGTALQSTFYNMKLAVIFFTVFMLICLENETISAATTTVSATATIDASIDISKDYDKKISATGGDLDFGVIIADNESGYVTIDPADGKRHSSKKTSDVKNFGPAAFIVKGAKKKNHSIVLQANSIIVESNGNKMTVDKLLSNITEGTINDNGESDFTVGGTLHINPDQPSGTYTGTFCVSAAYN